MGEGVRIALESAAPWVSELFSEERYIEGG